MKKTFIRVLAMVMSIMMLVACFVVTSNAADSTAITVDGKYKAADNKVTLEISLSKNTGLNTLVLNLGYNDKALKLDSVTNGTVFADSNNGSMFEVNTARNPLILYFDEAGINNITATGLVVTLVFSVVAEGEYGFDLVVDKDNTFASDTSKVAPVDIDEVKVSVAEASNRTPGDINGDEKVNAVDASLMTKNIVGSYSFDADQTKAADINGDNKINAQDLVLLKKIILGVAN